MKVLRTVLVFLAAASIVGCTVGPDYHRPPSNPPTQWSETLSGGETNKSPSIATWWKSFNDPELDSLVARAVHSNLDLRIAEARVREARAQRGIVDADFWPSVDTSASYARARESANQPLLGQLDLPPSVSLENDVYQAGFDASWEIDVFGGTRRAAEAANAQIAAAVYSRQDVQVTLVSEVARNYIEARSFQRRLAIARQNIKAQQDTVALARDRYKQGLTNSLDAEQAATVLAQTETQVPLLENGLQASIHHIGVLLGQQPGALLTELATEAPMPATPPQVPVGLPSDLLLRRPDIRNAERQLAAATAQIGVATADLFPKFSLTGDIGLESVSTSDFFTSGSRFFSAGPTVQWRIFDAGRIRSNIRVQNARQEQALATYEKTVLTSFEDVENTLVAYAKDQDRNVSLNEAVKTSQNSLGISRRLYVDGLTSFINVLDAERSLYQSQDDLAQSDQAVTEDLIALYKALGGGWEEPMPASISSSTIETVSVGVGEGK
ncbi:MAG: efflux transporter outer membrane subunit [Tepidisphaeraceae bacterium]|jgi:NodT family efflux transporter outer membrane factor (OMF) lipoprotein